jgi:hypothetical protein
MKKLLSTMAVFAFLLGGLSLTTAAKSKTWTGWISDSNCGAKGANASHKGCAIECVKEKGASWVFVDGTTNNVISISNQSAINENDLGHEVTVSGTLAKDGSLHVTKVAEAKAMSKEKM